MILFLILNKLDFKQAAQNFQIPPEISVKFSFISPKKSSEIFLGGGEMLTGRVVIIIIIIIIKYFIFYII